MRDPSQQPNLENYEPMQSKPIQDTPVGGYPGGTTSYPEAPNPFLRSPLPPSQQTSVDQLRQFYRAGTPQGRVLPLQPNASPASNAAAQSVAQSVVNTTTVDLNLALNMPSIFSVAGSPVTKSPGEFDVSLVPELAGTVFSGPVPSGISADFDKAITAFANTATITAAATPAATPEAAIFVGTTFTGTQSGTWAPSGGWTSIDTATATGEVWANVGVYSASAGISTAHWCSTMALFGTTGTSIAKIQQVAGTSGSIGGSSTPSTFSSPVTAGSTILVFINSANAPVPCSFASATDTLGNSYFQIANSNDGGFVQHVLLVATNSPGGSDTVTVVIPAASMFAGSVTIYELTGLGPVSGIPTFKPLTGAYIPPINLAEVGINGGVTGQLPHANIAATAVTPGSYSAANITVQADGTITAASNGAGGVSAKTTNYTAVGADSGKIISFNSAGAVTLTLPAAPPSTAWNIFVEDVGAGTLTVSRNGLLIDGAATNLTLTTGQGVYLATDGTNYYTERGMGGGGGGGITSINSQTGPAITITNGSGISVATTTNTVTISASGGGGGIPTGSNVCMLTNNPIGQDNGYAGTTICLRIPQGCIANQATKVILNWRIKSGTQTLGAAVVRTVPLGSNTFNVGSATLTWGGSGTPTLNPGNNISDTCTVTIDGTNDVVFMLFVNTASSDVLYTFQDLMGLNGAGTTIKYSGWVSGNQTAAASFPSTLFGEVAGWAQITTA